MDGHSNSVVAEKRKKKTVDNVMAIAYRELVTFTFKQLRKLKCDLLEVNDAI